MTQLRAYDVIVVGLGGIGSAVICELARQNLRVLGIDQYQSPHNFGSSHGHHRIIREAYFESPEYVPLVQHAYERWRELEQESGRGDLLTIIGGLMFGLPDSHVVSGATLAARTHRLPSERLTPEDVRSRFPGFRLGEDMVAIYEPNAGYVRPEAATTAHLDLAAANGAELRFGEPVMGWAPDGAGVRVTTKSGDELASRLVLTPGPWAPELLKGLNLPLSVRRIVNVYFDSAYHQLFEPVQCPIYIFDAPQGTYYGFPYLRDIGLKIGRHDDGEPATPGTIQREVNAGEVQQLEDVLNTYLPGASGPVKETLTCMYTMTPDENFIVDRHPEYPQVVIGCGFSGHGYKFAPALGELLADLALDRQIAFDIDFLSARRFIRSPQWGSSSKPSVSQSN